MEDLVFIIEGKRVAVTITFRTKIGDFIKGLELSEENDIRVCTKAGVVLDVNKTFRENGVKANDTLEVVVV